MSEHTSLRVICMDDSVLFIGGPLCRLKNFPTEKTSGIPLESTGILVEFYWNSSGIKGTFFHWKRAILLEFPLDSTGNSTGSVEIPLDSVEIHLDSSGIPFDSSGIPMEWNST